MEKTFEEKLQRHLESAEYELDNLGTIVASMKISMEIMEKNLATRNDHEALEQEFGYFAKDYNRFLYQKNTLLDIAKRIVGLAKENGLNFEKIGMPDEWEW